MKSQRIKYSIFLTAIALGLFALSVSAYANEEDAEELRRAVGAGFSNVETLSVQAGYEPVYRPKTIDSGLILDNDATPPQQPHFVEIKFQRIPDPHGISGRINQLVSGITLDIDPVYDHYGYEIRRYMAHAGDLRIYTDPKFLIKQLNNVKKAKIVADYWMQYLNEQMKELDAYFEGQGSMSYVDRSNYRAAKKKTQVFQVVLNGWLNANEQYLTELYELQGEYALEYPYLRVVNNAKVKLYNTLERRQARLIDLHNFPLFIMMVN